MRASVLVLLGAVLGLAACGVGEDVCARVGSHEIDVESLQRYLTGVSGKVWQEVEEPVASRLMDQFLDQEVVAESVRGQRAVVIPSDPGERSAVLRSLLREVCGQPPPVPPEELGAEVEARMTEVRPARAHVRQLLVDDLESAQRAVERLASGEDFVALSREVSRAPNAESGGELGFLEQGVLTPEVDEVIFALQAGEVSAPVEGPAGHHVFQVLEIVEAGPPVRADVVAEAERRLGQQAAQRFSRQCIQRLAGEVGVEVYPDNIWFRYQGRYAEDRDDRD
jgi:parvulin-like peptidyl-prolyl isomerase